jgi:hypothetical protein
MKYPSTGLVFGLSFHLWSPLRKNHPSYAHAVIVATPEVSTLVGTAIFADGIGTNAMFSSPFGIRISSDGAFALAIDQTNNLIRHIVLSTSSMTTLAGDPRISGSSNGIGTIAN